MNTQKTKSRCNRARKFLIFWCLFIGLGAVWGSSSMLLAPDGRILHMQGLIPFFQVLPFADVLFQNFIFPGIALLCVNGLPNLIAAYFMLRKRPIGLWLGGIFGVTLMMWICIQFIIFPSNPLSISYFIFGLAQALTGYMAVVFYKQESFSKEKREYPDIASKQDEIVIYFSRMGYTKKVAHEIAETSGASVYEVKSTERTEGTLGFWWCGRYGMHQWSMPIEPITIDWDQYKKVTICSPIWVFHLAAPMREFCKEASGKVKCVDYVLVHHQRSIYHNAIEEMDHLLGIKHQHATSICYRVGKEVCRKHVD